MVLADATNEPPLETFLGPLRVFARSGLPVGVVVAAAYLLASTLTGNQRAGSVAALAAVVVMLVGYLVARIARRRGTDVSLRPPDRLALAACLGLLGGAVYALLVPTVDMAAAAATGAALLVGYVVLTTVRLRGR